MMQTGNFFVPPDQIYERLPIAIFWGVSTGLLIYFVYNREYQREKPTFVCIKCGATKVADADSSSKCECGGDFESVRNMKWIDDPK